MQEQIDVRTCTSFGLLRGGGEREGEKSFHVNPERCITPFSTASCVPQYDYMP